MEARPALAPTQTPVQWVPSLFPGGKVAGGGGGWRGVDQPPSSGAEVKERVEQYLNYYSGPS
jgi:hypothetical protein